MAIIGTIKRAKRERVISERDQRARMKRIRKEIRSARPAKRWFVKDAPIAVNVIVDDFDDDDGMFEMFEDGA